MVLLAASFPRKWPLLQGVGPHLKTESGVKTEDFLLGDYLQPPHHPFSFWWCMWIYTVLGFPYIGHTRFHESFLGSPSVPSALAPSCKTIWLLRTIRHHLVSFASWSHHPHCMGLCQALQIWILACRRKSPNCMSGTCELWLLWVFVANLNLLEIKEKWRTNHYLKIHSFIYIDQNTFNVQAFFNIHILELPCIQCNLVEL